MTYDDTNDTYTILGAGKDIWSTSDQFHFAWKKLTGDGSITARIESVQDVNPWTKVGIMLRDSLASDSKCATAFVGPQGKVGFQYRDQRQGLTGSTRYNYDPNHFKLPHWMRLTRHGNKFIATQSSDGVIWKPMEDNRNATKPSDAVIEMDQSIYIGLVVTSHAGPAVTAEARISDVTVTGDVESVGEFLWSEDIGFKLIALPDK